MAKAKAAKGCGTGKKDGKTDHKAEILKRIQAVSYTCDTCKVFNDFLVRQEVTYSAVC